MFANYLKVALRNILRNKTFSFINIFGLAAAMSVCMLIMLIIADQKSYDRWQVNRNRIYRIQTVGKYGNGMRPMASSALPLAERLRKGFTGIEASAGLAKAIGGDMHYNDKLATGAGYFADGNLFKVLDFPLQQGDPRTALERPFSMVITDKLARQLFNDQDPIGKTVTFTNTGVNPAGFETGNSETNYGRFTITGVLRANPGKTTLPFTLLASLSTLGPLTKDTILNYPPNDWANLWTNYTFVLLQKGRSKADLQRILDKISDEQYPKGGGGPQVAFQAVVLSELMPADPIGNPTNIGMPKMILIVLSVLCLVVMLSACLNYTNLSMARLVSRAREVGIRKVSGATRRQVFVQFIAEAVVMSLIALVLSLGLLFVFQRLFSGLWLNQYLKISFDYTPGLILFFWGFSVLVGALAGLLPSIYISLFNPVDVLKGLNSIKAFKRLGLRKVLLVVQFTVSLVFIISTTLIYLQGRHVLHFDYGFDKDNVVNIKLFRPDNYGRFVSAISASRSIAAVSACTFPPATGSNNAEMVYKAGNRKDSLTVNYIDIDAGCLQVWGLQLLAGRNLPAVASDSGDRYVLVNENMVSALHYGSLRQAVGQHLLVGGRDAEILGVVKDFTFLDVTRGMEPLLLRNRQKEFGYITVRVQGPHPAATVAFMQAAWKRVNPGSRFDYEYFDQQLLITHAMLADTAGVLSVLALLAVLISCLGLLGMATYTAESRRKEISLRKVLGSSVAQVIVLLARGFMILLGVAVAVAVPLAYIVNGMWLQFFASRVSISPWMVAANVGVLALVCFLIVFSQAWRVSRVSPAVSLRRE